MTASRSCQEVTRVSRKLARASWTPEVVACPCTMAVTVSVVSVGLALSVGVTSSSSYLNSSEVKAGMLEVWRFPGIGFSLCTVPTFSHVQGISNGGYESSFRNVLEWRMCTGMITSTSVKLRETEVQSLYGLEVRGMCEIELALLEESSRVRQIRVKFDIQNVETYMTRGT